MESFRSAMSRLAATISLLFFTIHSALAGPSLSVSPSPIETDAGSSFVLNIIVTDVVDLFAYQFDVNFDPTLLNAISTSEGSFLGGAGSTFFSPGLIDNVTGSTSFVSGALFGFVPGASGSGVLATISLGSLPFVEGFAMVTFSNVLFLDSSLNPIDDVSLHGGQVQFAQITAVPEPSTVALLAVGLLVVWTSGRRSRRHTTSSNYLL